MDECLKSLMLQCKFDWPVCDGRPLRARVCVCVCVFVNLLSHPALLSANEDFDHMTSDLSKPVQWVSAAASAHKHTHTLYSHWERLHTHTHTHTGYSPVLHDESRPVVDGCVSDERVTHSLFYQMSFPLHIWSRTLSASHHMQNHY